MRKPERCGRQKQTLHHPHACCTILHSNYSQPSAQARLLVTATPDRGLWLPAASSLGLGALCSAKGERELLPLPDRGLMLPTGVSPPGLLAPLGCCCWADRPLTL